jgi:hypothetical protein
MKKIIGWFIFIFCAIGFAYSAVSSLSDGIVSLKDIIGMIFWAIPIFVVLILVDIGRYRKQNKNLPVYVIAGLAILVTIFIITGYSSSDTGQGSTYADTNNSETYAASYLNVNNSGYKKAQANSSIEVEEAYQKGYQEGYQDGFNEAQANLSTKVKEAYQKGYQEGFDESTRLFEPKDELIKILSYSLERDSVLWVKVVGELQNISNKSIYTEVTCALLDDSGQIVATNPSYETLELSLEPQQKAFFTFDSFYQQPLAVDARFTVNWKEK